MMRCKTCGAELKKVGFATDFYQRYECPNGCEDIFRFRDKAMNTLRELLAIPLIVILGILVFLIAGFLKVFGFLKRD
ncbi:hypothetical protein DRP07_00370 [Archaeoglobales archaeon]|nr:MAG: hypothetical protein DRP07_00370 [Archaeoglobales archaeon]